MKDLEDDEREFPIRVYTKVELALLYAPHLSENAALNNLSRWMRHNKLLMAALEEVGYYKYRHSLFFLHLMLPVLPYIERSDELPWA